MSKLLSQLICFDAHIVFHAGKGETVYKSRFCEVHIKLGKKSQTWKKRSFYSTHNKSTRSFLCQSLIIPGRCRQGQPQSRKTKCGNKAEVVVTTEGSSRRQTEDGLAPERPAEDHEMDLTIRQWHVLIGIRRVQQQMFYWIIGLDISKIPVPIWVKKPQYSSLRRLVFCGIILLAGRVKMEGHSRKPRALTKCLRLMESEESVLLFLCDWAIAVLDQ